MAIKTWVLDLETNVKMLMKLFTAVVCGDLVTGGDASFQSFVVMEQVAVWASGYHIQEVCWSLWGLKHVDSVSVRNNTPSNKQRVEAHTSSAP